MEFELEFSAELEAVHSIFYISLLKKFVRDPASLVPSERVVVKHNLSNEDSPYEILYRIGRMFKNK